MDANAMWIALAVVAVLVVIAIAYLAMRQRRTAKIRNEFGAEYDYAVRSSGGHRSAAEKELMERAERVREYDIRPLSAVERDRFTQDWRAIQGMFVDEPEKAVERADRVIGDVMAARGYPVGDIEQRAADISVGHGDVVRDYRIAHGLTVAHEPTAQARTEDLRQAMVRFRSIFDELVTEEQRRERV